MRNFVTMLNNTEMLLLFYYRAAIAKLSTYLAHALCQWVSYVIFYMGIGNIKFTTDSEGDIT